MPQNKNAEPLYRQLYHRFRKNIADGIWKTGDQVPGEMQLCEAYQVSRITVRQAMNLLKAEGYIMRTPGKGSFISEPPIEQKLNSFYSFSDDGAKVTSTVLRYDPQKISPEQCDIFRLPAGETVIRLERIRYRDAVPFAHEISCFPLRYFPGINRNAIAEDGLYNSFQRFGGIRPDLAEETFEAVRIGHISAEHLQVSASGPAMHITRIARYRDTVIEHCDSIVRSDRIRYRIIMPSP